MAIKYHYNQFPPVLELDQQVQTLIAHARTELGRYDGFLLSMANNLVLLSPLFTQEAVFSSKIEGTQSTLTEVLEYEAGAQNHFDENKKNDIREVINYRYALKKAEKLLNDNIPLSQRVLKESHAQLMIGVRGENKTPGEYRKIPVWIGSDASNIDLARFIPVDANHISSTMSIFEKYIHDNDDYDDLIKIALLHAEFEAIHPFLDGNGRLGRLLIPLYLSEKRLLSSPSFYISHYFEKNREIYYELLLNVSKKNDWLRWCKFFIQGVIEQAKDNLARAKSIVSYYNDLKKIIPTMSKSQHGITALDYIFKFNYFNSTTFCDEVTIPRPTARRLLNVFVKHNILVCSKGSGRTPNFYVFKKLIDIADGKT